MARTLAVSAYAVNRSSENSSGHLDILVTVTFDFSSRIRVRNALTAGGSTSLAASFPSGLAACPGPVHVFSLVGYATRRSNARLYIGYGLRIGGRKHVRPRGRFAPNKIVFANDDREIEIDFVWDLDQRDVVISDFS